MRLTFWLGNVLRATTACTFSTSQLLKVVRDRQLLTLLTWKCASALASLLFDPPEPQIIGKTQWIATFSTFSRTCIFFLLTLSLDSFSSLIFSLLLFSSLTLPTSAFPSIGSLTSKLPSTICMLLIYIYIHIYIYVCVYVHMYVYIYAIEIDPLHHSILQNLPHPSWRKRRWTAAAGSCRVCCTVSAHLPWDVGSMMDVCITDMGWNSSWISWIWVYKPIKRIDAGDLRWE